MESSDPVVTSALGSLPGSAANCAAASLNGNASQRGDVPPARKSMRQFGASRAGSRPALISAGPSQLQNKSIVLHSKQDTTCLKCLQGRSSDATRSSVDGVEHHVEHEDYLTTGQEDAKSLQEAIQDLFSGWDFPCLQDFLFL